MTAQEEEKKISTDILDELLNAQKKKAKSQRSTRCLKNPDSEYADNWFMQIPKCFNDALDIKRTIRTLKGRQDLVWTQGVNFSFKPGDTLYDTPKAYLKWDDALQHIKICLQVKSETIDEVQIDIMTPDDKRKKLISVGSVCMTQTELVRFLIDGQNKKIQSLVNF